ncbi:hypothetical protein O9A_01291 [Bartonella koehlerae C-29]|uniref:Cytochrome c1 n=1 Tax=Bartonella koehlerae C-29 TaxID=1134510 RepID=A0A067WFI8_9HYPH|nr:hypothetical protein O9A_01291 [Bartonella koehlerae C-29]
MQLQRGLKVYKQFCFGCHGLKHVAFRDLKAFGYDQKRIKTFARQYEMKDSSNREGKFFKSIGVTTDAFSSPFDNKKRSKIYS